MLEATTQAAPSEPTVTIPRIPAQACPWFKGTNWTLVLKRKACVSGGGNFLAVQNLGGKVVGYFGFDLKKEITEQIAHDLFF